MGDHRTPSQPTNQSGVGTLNLWQQHRATQSRRCPRVPPFWAPVSLGRPERALTRWLAGWHAQLTCVLLVCLPNQTVWSSSVRTSRTWPTTPVQARPDLTKPLIPKRQRKGVTFASLPPAPRLELSCLLPFRHRNRNATLRRQTSTEAYLSISISFITRHPECICLQLPGRCSLWRRWPSSWPARTTLCCLHTASSASTRACTATTR